MLGLEPMLRLSCSLLAALSIACDDSAPDETPLPACAAMPTETEDWCLIDWGNPTVTPGLDGRLLFGCGSWAFHDCNVAAMTGSRAMVAADSLHDCVRFESSDAAILVVGPPAFHPTSCDGYWAASVESLTAGDFEIAAVDAHGRLDAIVWRVRDPARVFLAQVENAETISPLTIGTGETMFLEVRAVDATGELLSTGAGATFEIADSAVATISAWASAPEPRVEAAFVELAPVAPGTTTLRWTVAPHTGEITLHVRY